MPEMQEQFLAMSGMYHMSEMQEQFLTMSGRNYYFIRFDTTE